MLRTGIQAAANGGHNRALAELGEASLVKRFSLTAVSSEMTHKEFLYKLIKCL